ncbi:dihydrodipicolinate synthase family protein [Kribbella sp. NPDC050124]|uniref:dihydrodipicolinate synthase family protein n=1 Tax=Kribbella sp. NPDC050124 TaxID=3364114 RepID=UPI00378CEDF6
MSLRGVFSAVATPFDANYAVDESGLRTLVERTVDGGIHGLVPCGSTGEFAALSTDERRFVVETVIDQAGGRVPVVAHTGALATSEAIALSKHAEAAGAAAVMAVAPFYEPLDLDEVKAYYRAIADAVSVPVMVYNLPVATGVNLLPHELADLASKSPNVKYVKDTTGDFGQAGRLIHDYAEVITTFVGQDTLFFATFFEGGAGSIVGACNFAAPELVSIYNSILAGDVATAKREWDTIFPLMQFLVSGGYVAGVKGALDALGVSAGPSRAPIAALNDERRTELEGILKKLQLHVKA